MPLIDQALNDTLALDSDAVLASMSFSLLSIDSLDSLDDLSVDVDQGRLAIDNLTVSDSSASGASYARFPTVNVISLQDQASPSLEQGIVLADTADAVDAAFSGLEKDALVQDAVMVTESDFTDIVYHRDSNDTLDSSDEVYPWIDGKLTATFQGDSSWTALALVKHPPEARPVPPKAQVVPKPPDLEANNFVVNPTPHHRV